MTPGPAATSRGAWPELPLARWSDTRDTMQLWTQVVGKVRLALEPMVNHWWQVPLYVDARGLTTSLMPYGAIGLEMVFDFRRHVLELRTTDGRTAEVDLRGRSVADFYADVLARLADLDIQIDLMGRPVELPEVVPFADDRQHCAYDPEFAHAFWISLVQAHRVFTRFRSRFVGKVSPVHFFWGAFDLAVTRFSGRPAPLHPGGVPNCPDRVSHEAYSHEVSSCGYWPGGGGQGSFYAYAYPEPPGFGDRVPPAGRYDAQLGEFLLPYETVARADDPDAVLLEFLQHTYEYAADLAAWDRTALERA
ncbi:hypothetical protein Cs7R123_55120 [Catellatospora sp. TT07R-123]|uniref:DUF5996 family protein n=1 Tax=Catellatospora sp. TT07R-123 TaxID=2733863 RepID=UPI001B1D52AB|nr:DUF5996 family protein [Catellatospora sp. TT07R-123]GHJ48170.1 hypothetical protein Cs7R123_55120 [Catellatospora sp. TT07R-123]